MSLCLEIEDNAGAQLDSLVGELDELAVDRFKPWVDRLREPPFKPSEHELALLGVQVVHVSRVDERIAQPVYRADEVLIEEILVPPRLVRMIPSAPASLGRFREYSRSS